MTASAPTALAKRPALARSIPSSIATVKAAQNESPAPVGSTSSTAKRRNADIVLLGEDAASACALLQDHDLALGGKHAASLLVRVGSGQHRGFPEAWQHQIGAFERGSAEPSNLIHAQDFGPDIGIET